LFGEDIEKRQINLSILSVLALYEQKETHYVRVESLWWSVIGSSHRGRSTGVVTRDWALTTAAVIISQFWAKAFSEVIWTRTSWCN